MVKKGFGSITLAAALSAFALPAAAQNYKGTPKPTVREYQTPIGKVGFTDISSLKTVSGKCGNPAAACLFYGGDFLYDPLYSPISNALANENTLLVWNSVRRRNLGSVYRARRQDLGGEGTVHE